MPAVPLFIMDPLWSQCEALIPPIIDNHPLGCHRPRVADRVIFDKLIQVLVLGAAYEKISDTGCSATTIRRRRDEWIEAGIFPALEQICLEAYDRIVGLDLENLCVDGCIVKAPVVAKSRGNPQSTAANRAPNVPWLPMATASHWAAWVHQPTATTHHC